MLNGQDINNVSMSRYDGAVAVTTLRNINERTITGTTETTMIPTTIRGTKTIRTEQFEAGSTYKIFGYCQLTTGANQTGTIRVKIGSTTLVSESATLTSNLSSARAKFEIIVTITAIGASGKAGVSGDLTIFNTIPPNLGNVVGRAIATASDVTIDTTANRDIDVTYQFGATGNTLQVREFNIERL